MNEKLQKIGNIIFHTGYIAFIVLVITLALILAVSALPIPGNYKIKIVKSGSMEPAIDTGSIVIIRPDTTYAIGDVVTFGKDTKKDIPTTHRIVEMRTTEGNYVYRMKGDANQEPDTNEIEHSAIIGKVIFDVPYFGYLLHMAKQPLGFFLLVILPAGLIIIDELRNIFVEVRKRKRKASGEKIETPIV